MSLRGKRCLGGSLYLMTCGGLLMPSGNVAYMWTIPGSASFVFSFLKKKKPRATAFYACNDGVSTLVYKCYFSAVAS